MVAVPLQEFVEGGRIRKDGGLGDGGVVALLVAVGGESVEVEGNQRSAGGLRTPYALNRRMEPCNRAAIARYEANRRAAVARRAEPIPQRSGSRPIMDANIISSFAV